MITNKDNNQEGAGIEFIDNKIYLLLINDFGEK